MDQWWVYHINMRLKEEGRNGTILWDVIPCNLVDK